MFPVINLKDYEKIKIIGQGSNGIVYIVKNKSNKKFVVKESLNECNSQKNQKIFFNEIFSYFKLRYPAILSAVGFSIQNFEKYNFPLIMLEYMINDSLRKVLDKYSRFISAGQFDKIPIDDGFSSTNLYIILLGVSLGMKYIHSQNVVHRDLKPDNILLDENFYPRISDFGSSSIANSNISQYIMKSQEGTPLYMPPEVFENESYDYKVDVYSFSLIAYELLTGNRPFSEYKTSYQIQTAVSKNIRPNGKIIKDKTIQDFLNRCWSSDPKERPPFDEIVDELLDIKYVEYFNANEDDVNKYLSQFDEKIEIKKTTLPSIKAETIIEREIPVEMSEEPLLNVQSKLPKLITEPKNNLSCRPRPMTANINQSLKAINLSATNSQSKLPTIKPKQPLVKIIPPVAKDETPDSTLLSETKNDSLDINMHDDVDFTKLSVKFIRLTTPELRDTVYALNVNIVKDISQGDVIWYDGQLKSKNYANIHPSKHVNKIPDLCYLCKNNHFFGCLKQMKEKYPDFCKDYIPMTYLLPDEIDEFKDANSTSLQWILRQSINGTNTCALIDDPLNFTIPKKGGIVQPLIPPFLIDSHKFALRMYAVISNLNPLTIHFYKEGIANFCAEPYDAPNNENKLSYIFDPKCTPKDNGFNYYRPASTVISTISETNPNLLKQIKDIVVLSIFSICPDMKKRVELTCENNDKSFGIGDDSIIPPFERFIHLVGVDIQIDENGNPFVVGLKDNPGLKSTNEDEKKIKCELIKSQLALIISLIGKSKKEGENWEQVFSSNTLQFKPKTPDHPKRNCYSPRRIRNILNQNKKELNDI